MTPVNSERFSSLIFFHFSSSTPSPTNLYTNTTWGFSLTLSQGFNVYPPDPTDASTTGEAMVFESATNSVQLEITPYQYSDTMLTLADVEQEEPYLTPANVQMISLPFGITAISFTDPTTDAAQQSELWFLSKGDLYLFTAAANDGPLLSTVALTFHSF